MGALRTALDVEAALTPAEVGGVTSVYGSNDEAAVQWHMPVAAPLLEHREILCEVEGAVFKTDPGVLIVTDLRVLFAGRKLFRRKVKVSSSTPLGDLESAEAEERPWWPRRRKMGVVVLLVPNEPRIEFECIEGALDRAEQIVGTILLQKRYLAKAESAGS